jgi:hypothetical protein
MIAHQGGWDELLLPALVVALVLAVPMIRRRRRAAGPTRPEPRVERDPDACAYCGAAVHEADQRCPACGFRLRLRP